jgi:hypothetical protein
MVWNMQKSAIEEIKELKARLESITEQAKTEALDQASEAIGFLRVLGLDNDTILKELGFRGRAKAESREGTPPKDEPCQICHFRTDPPHDGRTHRGQTKKKPFTPKELQEKGLTKVSRSRAAVVPGTVSKPLSVPLPVGPTRGWDRPKRPSSETINVDQDPSAVHGAGILARRRRSDGHPD